MTHLSMEALLELRSAPAAENSPLASCGECARQLEALQTVQRELRGLPPLRPPAALWSRIAEQVSAQRRRRRRLRAAVLAGVAASLLAWVALSGRPSRAPTVEHQRVAELKRESAELEVELRALGAPRLLDARTASAIIELEDQLDLIDAHLGAALESDQPGDEALFWRARVQTLRELLDTRAAQTSTASL